MTVLAPPDTHISFDDQEAVDVDVEELELDEERPCHLLDDELAPICGAEAGLGMAVHALPASAAGESPCAGGCGRPRCEPCAALVEELGA